MNFNESMKINFTLDLLFSFLFTLLFSVVLSYNLASFCSMSDIRKMETIQEHSLRIVYNDRPSDRPTQNFSPSRICPICKSIA